MNLKFVSHALAGLKKRLPSSKGADPEWMERRLEEVRELDHERNAETTPPDEEHVDLCCIWATEFYTPGQMGALRNNLLRFEEETLRSMHTGWDTRSNLEEMLRSPTAGHWVDLGIWTPEDSPMRPLMQHRVVKLPDGVAHAQGKVLAVSPSIIAVVVCFVFDEGITDMFDRALRKDRQAYGVRYPGGIRYHGPANQKAEYIQQTREALSVKAEGWFKMNIPGVFSSGVLPGPIPTCELVRLRSGEPFPPQGTYGFREMEYLFALGYAYDADAWWDTAIPALKFGDHMRSETSPPHHSAIAINEQRWLDADMEAYGAEPRNRLINYTWHFMPELLCMWALWPFIQGYNERVNMVRNSSDFRIADRNSIQRIWRNFQNHINNLSDVEAVSSDLLEDAFPPWNIRQVARQFRPCLEFPSTENPNLGARLTSAITNQAKWLRSAENSLMNQLTSLGSTIASYENVRLQKRVAVLTIVIVILTILTLPASAKTVVDTGWLAQGIDWIKHIVWLTTAPLS